MENGILWKSLKLATTLLSNPPKFDRMLVDSFALMLDGYSDTEIKNAFVRHMKREKWFPTPADIIALIDDTRHPQLDSPFDEALKIASNSWHPKSCDAILCEAINHFGGISALGDLEQRWYDKHRKAFNADYLEIRKRFLDSPPQQLPQLTGKSGVKVKSYMPSEAHNRTLKQLNGVSDTETGVGNKTSLRIETTASEETTQSKKNNLGRKKIEFSKLREELLK